jgi:hypothetical protein
MSSPRSARGSSLRQSIGFTRAPRPLFGIKAVGSFVPRLTAKAFEKYGFSVVGLITDWPAIVGRELAGFTAPERVKWQRGRGEEDGEAQGAQHRGATLVLRVDGARALDVQFGAQQLIERVNAYFGYRAIAELRIVQAPVEAKGIEKRPPRIAAEPLTREVAGVADAALRNALARLGAGIRAGR